MERLTKKEGFTILELVMVIVILGILAAAISFKWSKSTFGLSTQAELLVNDLRYTQNLSMSRNKQFSWEKTSANTYTIKDDDNNAVLNSINLATTTLAPDITFGGTVTYNKITFDTKGVPYNGTVTSPVALTSNATIPLVMNGKSINVIIEPETGRIYIQ